MNAATQTSRVRVLIECGCSLIEETLAHPQDPDLFGGAKELIAEHRLARRCRQPFRLRAIALDSELGQLDARAALLALDVEALLAEALR